jgi:hypothetical protein
VLSTVRKEEQYATWYCHSAIENKHFLYVDTQITPLCPRSVIAMGVNGGVNERRGGLCVDAKPLLMRFCAELLLLYMS